MPRCDLDYNDSIYDNKYSGCCTSGNRCSPRPCCERPNNCCCVGPAGPTGAAGATILGSYNTLQELQAAHPTGTAGEAYLVGGNLYVWNANTRSWQNMGSLIGPTGPTGAAGATILGSYRTLEELVAAHPTGTAGDAYLVGGNLYVWNADTGSWQNVGSLTGPTGPTGAAGATILGSYETLQELQEAHPTGTPGDAYLVGGDLYVWSAETGSWQNMGSLIGPTGPTGAAGATILGSYDTLAELEEAHPTGTAGDAYLVGGELYVWNADTNSWQNMGSLVGPTGPTGAAGATILGSYDTLQELQQAHPTGTAGDAYLVGGELYVWSAETGSWENMGSLLGPTGPTGAAGATILDSYDSLQELEQAHPTGTAGDAYLVGGELYVWNADTSSWQNMGSLVGPAGPTGATGAVGTILGSYDTLQDLINEHPTGNQGDSYLVDGVLYVWDSENNEWRAVGNLRAPASESRTIIPFASTIAPLTYSSNGNPSRVSLIGFGYGNGGLNASTIDDYSIPTDNSDGHFDLDENDDSANFQLAFSLPFDMTIRSIVLTCGTYGEWTFTSAVYPYVQLYSAEPASNSFRVINGAVAIPEEGIGPGLERRGTMRYAITEGLDITLSAGTRIAIGGLMRTVVQTGTSGVEEYWLYFTGSVGLSYSPEE